MRPTPSVRRRLPGTFRVDGNGAGAEWSLRVGGGAQQPRVILDSVKRHAVGVMEVVCAVIGHTDHVDDVGAVELPVHVLEAGQSHRVLPRQVLIVFLYY